MFRKKKQRKRLEEEKKQKEAEIRAALAVIDPKLALLLSRQRLKSGEVSDEMSTAVENSMEASGGAAGGSAKPSLKTLSKDSVMMRSDMSDMDENPMTKDVKVENPLEVE